MLFADKATKRKKRNIKILKDEGVPYIDHLPKIQDDISLKIRDKEEICYRALSLGLIAALGEGLEDDVFWDKVHEFNVTDRLTPEELEFANMQERTMSQRAKFTWRYESLWVLLWSLGYIDSLGRPDHICDVQQAVSILIAQSFNEFINKARLRGVNEILDMTDLMFRYNWATTEARLKGEDGVAGLMNGVVYEWHYALNWLVDAYNEEWDDVSTNT